MVHLRLADLRRTCKTNPARSVEAILKGYAVPRGRTGPSVGDLLVPDPRRGRGDGMRAAREALRTFPGLSRYQAATILGCRVETVDGLIEAGHLDVCSEGRGWRRIDEVSVDAFRRTWARADIYAEAVRAARPGHETGQLLERLGARTLPVFQKDGSVAHMVERTGARSLLELSRDPDDPAGGGVLAFEAVLLRALGWRGTFKLVGRSRCLTLSSAAGDLTLRIKVQPDREAVEVVLIRGARPPGDVPAQAALGGQLLWREVDRSARSGRHRIGSRAFDPCRLAGTRGSHRRQHGVAAGDVSAGSEGHHDQGRSCHRAPLAWRESNPPAHDMMWPSGRVTGPHFRTSDTGYRVEKRAFQWFTNDPGSRAACMPTQCLAGTWGVRRRQPAAQRVRVDPAGLSDRC